MKVAKVKIKETPPARGGYLLPFDSKEIKIFQGYNGPYSHSATRRGTCGILSDDRFAIDFALPLGTSVIASKSGIVYAVINNSPQYYEGLDLETGLRTCANFILLKHADKTLTLYSHLNGKSIQIERGMGIVKGQKIAETGKSGWIGPVHHLHFQALERVGSSFPVIFDNYPGSLEHSQLRLEDIL